MASTELDLRPLGRGDLKGLAELYGQEWPGPDWELRFQRQWLENPFQGEHAMGWVLADGSGLAGAFGSIPVPYRVDGHDAVAFAATALVVRADDRGRGHGRRLVEAFLRQPGGELWINATPNAPSARLFESLGFRRAEHPAIASRAYHVALPRDHARAALEARWRGPARILLPLATSVGAALLSRRSGALRRADDRGWEWSRLDGAGPEVDDIWSRARGAVATTLRRDADALRWLLFSGPSADRNSLYLGRDGGGAARAIATFRAEPETRRLRQVDAFGDTDEPGALVALARAASRDAAAADLAIVRLSARSASEARAYGSLGLDLEPDPREIQWVGPADEPRFCDLDGDRCLDVLL